MPVGKSDLKALASFKPGGGGGGNWYKPTPGTKARLRICPPYTEDMNVPFLGMRIHYFDMGEGEQGVSGVCPAVDGGKCAACDLFWSVQGQIPKGDTDLKEAIRGIKPNDRTYINVVDRESGQILVWSMPWGVASNISTHFNTYAEDGVDLSDPVKGHDLIIPCNKRGRSYVFGNVSVAPRATLIGIKGWEDELHDLEAAARQRELTSEQVEEAVPATLGEFYDAIMLLNKEAPKGKTHKKAKAPAAGQGTKKKKRATKAGGRKKKTTRGRRV